MQNGSFDIFAALAAWARVLSGWQVSLLQKLITCVDLSDESLAEVYARYLSDQGLASSSESPAQVDLELPEFRAEAAAHTKSHLTCLHSVSGVNALAPGERLAFGTNLTVVYGPNGAGKSGYARVLKAACFTRSKATEILGDVKIARDKQSKPKATFDFDDGSQETFVYGRPCKRLRDNFAVFDSSCVRVHLDDRNAFQVMPYLFDVFPRMVTALGRIQGKLREEIGRRTHAPEQFAIPDSTSPVARALAGLSSRSDVDQLKAWGVYGEPETTRLATVEQLLKDLRTSDPKDIVRRNEQWIADLKTLRSAVNAIPAKINPAILAAITDAIARIHLLVEKGQAISVAQFGNEPVQPIGTRAWRELVVAAIEYSREAGQPFPPTSDADRCVLCQQELSADSVRRLGGFYELALSKVEAELARTRQECAEKLSQLRAAPLGFFGDDSAVRRTLLELDAGLSQHVAGHVEGYSLVLRHFLDSADSEIDPKLSLLTYDVVSDRLSAHIERLVAENKALVQNDPKQIIQSLAAEEQLLRDRKHLAHHQNEILAAIEDMRWVDKANACLRAFSGIQREITSKQKALAKDLVGQGFIARFVENCAALGVTLPVQFRFAGDAGTTDRKIEISNAEVTGIAPSQVLSEGEQTAIALADFLTEVEINDRCIGLIFDDPVSSMDHLRKESIARRLVEEAERRQVIVFTHDILFTNYLAAAAEEDDVKFVGRTVWRDEEDAPGSVDRLAFPHEYYEGAAFDRARRYLDQARGASGEGQNDLLEKACGSLRTAYEDFIQKRLFGNIVRRWRENITFTLDQVFFDEGIANRVQQRMELLSRHIDAHSHSVEFHEDPLTTDLVSEELVLFDAIKKEYGGLRNAWLKSKPKKEDVFSY